MPALLLLPFPFRGFSGGHGGSAPTCPRPLPASSAVEASATSAGFPGGTVSRSSPFDERARTSPPFKERPGCSWTLENAR